MRLFNGGRDEKDSPPPPVPSVQDGVAKYNAVHQGQPRTTKISTPRVPVPSFASFDSQTGSKHVPPPLVLSPTSSTSTFASGPNSARSDESILPPPPRIHVDGDGPQSAPAHMSDFPALKLRPVSSLFSTPFGEHVLAASDAPTPLLPTASSFESNSDPDLVIRSLQDQLSSSHKAWQQQVWELQGQVRDLKAEIDHVHSGSTRDAGSYCDSCGRGRKLPIPLSNGSTDSLQANSVVNRPRARTGQSGATGRFGATY